MRQPAIVRVRTARSVALMQCREREMETRSTGLRLALELVTLLILGSSAVCATILAGPY